MQDVTVKKKRKVKKATKKRPELTPLKPEHLNTPRNKKIGGLSYYVAKYNNKDYIPNTVMRVTRPLVFDCAEDMIETFKEYANKSIEFNTPITFSGFCAFIGVHRETLYNKHVKYSWFNDTTKAILQAIELHLVNNGLNGTYQHQIAQLVLKNFHGFKDKVEVETSDKSVDYATNRQAVLDAINKAKQLKDNT